MKEAIQTSTQIHGPVFSQVIDSYVVDFMGACSRSLGAILNVLVKGPQTDPFVQNIEIKFNLEKHHVAF